MPDPLESLREGIVPLRPSDAFARELRGRLEAAVAPQRQRGGQMLGTTAPTGTLMPAMVHFGVTDPDRAMRFFAELFDWESERVEWQGSVTHYVYNVDGGEPVRTGHRGRPMPVLTNEPGPPDPRLAFTVDNLRDTIAAALAHGGALLDDHTEEDGSGYAFVDDGQGTRVMLWRPLGAYPTPPTTRPARALPGHVEIAVGDVARAEAFYEATLGWDPSNPAARARVTQGAEVRVYFEVDDLELVASRVRELGGDSGDVYEIVAGSARDCHDDQGTLFRVFSPSPR